MVDNREDWEEMLVTLAAAAFALSLLVIVHELGHFVLARLGGIRVLRFSLGLGPKLFGFRRGDTEWVLSWIPFGGYVKLAGTEPGRVEGEDWEFYSKRPWVRAMVIAAGPFFNFLLAIVIFSLVIWTTGIQVEKTTRVGKVEVGSRAYQAGIETGDEILSVDGEEVDTWDEVLESVAGASESPIRLEVLRDGNRRELVLAQEQQKGGLIIGLQPWIEPVVGGVKRRSPAQTLGLRKGDRIVEVEGREIEQWYDLVDVIGANPGDTLTIVWQRGGQAFEDSVISQIAKDMSVDGEVRKVGRLGILRMMEVEKLGLAASIREGFLNTAVWSTRFFAYLVSMVRRQVSPRTMGGIVSLVMLTGEGASWGVSWLFWLIAVFSVNLFIINLFPLPPLDGGNLVLVCVEGIKRGPISEKQKLLVQQIGIALLFILVFYVLRNDMAFWMSR